MDEDLFAFLSRDKPRHQAAGLARPAVRFRSAQGLAKWTIRLFVVVMFGCCVECVLKYLLIEELNSEWQISPNQRVRHLVQGGTLERAEMLVRTLLGVGFLALIVFLVWLYRVYRNLKPLGVPSPRFTPGWAVGLFFVPIASLIRPFTVMRELWRESDPSTRKQGMGVIAWWWFFHLSATHAIPIVFLWAYADIEGQNNVAAALEAWVYWLRVSFALDGLVLLTTIFDILVVFGITALQEDKAARLARESTSLPPPL